MQDGQRGEGLIPSTLQSPDLASLLRLAASQKADFLSAPPERRERAAKILMAMLIEAVGKMAGSDAVLAAYGKDELPRLDRKHPNYRKQELLNTLDRLNLASLVFRSAELLGGSLQRLSSELAAVAHGDEPRLLARIGGGRGQLTNAWRSGISRLRALEWDKFLEARGLGAGERHGAIAQAYGVDWTTIEAWPAQVRKSLGADVVEQCLALAAKASDPYFSNPQLQADHTGYLQMDGQVFRAEERERAERQRRKV